jgi:hypothetical protein
MMASDEPTVPTPTAVSDSPSGAWKRCAIMLTHRFCNANERDVCQGIRGMRKNISDSLSGSSFAQRSSPNKEADISVFLSRKEERFICDFFL